MGRHRDLLAAPLLALRVLAPPGLGPREVLFRRVTAGAIEPVEDVDTLVLGQGHRPPDDLGSVLEGPEAGLAI